MKFERSAKFEIYSVGKTVEDALHSLGIAMEWGCITDFELQPNEPHPPCNWYMRFKANGTSMKACGEYVTGGVIVTWWK